jgi:hypothetical protein
LLLKRVFRIKKNFVLAMQVLIYVLALYYVAITFVKIFICKPVQKFWNPKVPGTCLNSNTIFISDCIVSLITDFVILISPLPVIWGLQMDLKRKLGSSVALVVGAVYEFLLSLEMAFYRLLTHPEHVSRAFSALRSQSEPWTTTIKVMFSSPFCYTGTSTCSTHNYIG